MFNEYTKNIRVNLKNVIDRKKQITNRFIYTHCQHNLRCLTEVGKNITLLYKYNIEP